MYGSRSLHGECSLDALRGGGMGDGDGLAGGRAREGLASWRDRCGGLIDSMRPWPLVALGCTWGPGVGGDEMKELKEACEPNVFFLKGAADTDTDTAHDMDGGGRG